MPKVATTCRPACCAANLCRNKTPATNTINRVHVCFFITSLHVGTNILEIDPETSFCANFVAESPLFPVTNLSKMAFPDRFLEGCRGAAVRNYGDEYWLGRIPLLAEEGKMRHQKMPRSHRSGADGVV